MPCVEVRGSRVEYLDAGSGDAVVLLHSSASSAAQWRALAGQLSERYRVLAPDLYGYGASARWPGHGAFKLAHEAEIVHALLDQVGAQAHLVGHSYGGAVALHAARTRGGRFLSLVLIEPVAFYLLADRAEIAAVAEGVQRAVASGDYMGGCREFYEYWSGRGSWDAVPAAKQDAMARLMAKVAIEFHAAFSEPAGLADHRRISVPTLLLLGERSPKPTRRICELLAATLGDARLQIVEGAGHMSPLTHRDAVNALIAEHLAAQLEEVGV
ncbi:MAG TPA: alpha/beta hydrolase [Burkholderiales bacterium]|nr:alpha/beta hydrolase [Burkholderiales bacterium]